jgi:DDE superfamily endonuclease
MEDVLEVYTRPYNPLRPQVCIDEKSKELHSQVAIRHPLPMQTGRAARQDYEYKREGTANIFMMTEPLSGKRWVRVTERRTKADFAEQLRIMVDERYPDAEVIVLVVDNLNTHGPWVLYEAFSPEEAERIARRIEWHYTPEHGSWLNIAEIELSVLQLQCLNRRIPDKETLACEAAAWEQSRNQARTTVRWHFSTADARIKLRRLYPVHSQIVSI